MFFFFKLDMQIMSTPAGSAGSAGFYCSKWSNDEQDEYWLYYCGTNNLHKFGAAKQPITCVLESAFHATILLIEK